MSRIFFSFYLFFHVRYFFMKKNERKMMYDCKMHCRVKLKLGENPCGKFYMISFLNFRKRKMFHICRKFCESSHMRMYQQKFFLSAFHAYFCFQFFFSLSLASNGICLCCTNILRRGKTFFAAIRFCCSHFFNLKTHRKRIFD